MAVDPLPEFLRICVDKGIVDETSAKRIELYRRTRGLDIKSAPFVMLMEPPDPSLQFESFFITKGNSFAVELAKTVVQRSAAEVPYSPLYLYGDIGVGKTHLLSAIANGASGKNVLMASTADLEIELDRATCEDLRAQFVEWLSSFEILLVDDIQLCEGRENFQRILFTVFNSMSRSHRWLVISSDVPPTRLAGVEARLISRLGGGSIVNLHIGDRQERLDLVRHFLHGHRMHDDLVEFLADTVTDNVRELKATVSNLLGLAEWAGTEVTLDLARSLVADRNDSQAGGVPVVAKTGESKPLHVATSAFPGFSAERFKSMVAEAESEEEQVLALQIALAERIRQLREEGGDPGTLLRMERAIDLLRQGNLEEAVRCIQIPGRE
jgi:hypothetical protein